LPQAFKNLPTVFRTVLASDLKAFSANQHGCTFLLNVDGLTQEDCVEGTHLLLSVLWEAVYKLSRKKGQICQNTVKYLGFQLSKGQCRLGPERKENRLYVPSQLLRSTGN
jgi:hypothetical protein